MIYPEGFVPDLATCEFTIERLIIFDPTLKPKAKKPLEQDFQDAKLLYYYPNEIRVEIKRNDVGLAEGMVLFWGAYGEQNTTKNQIVYTNQYTYIIDNFEDTLWICLVMKSFTEETVYYPTDGYRSMSADSFRIDKPVLTKEMGAKFVKHFVDTFHLFYGKVSSYMTSEDRLSEGFLFIFEKFMVHYKKLNSKNFPKINMMKFLDSYINYAPIDKKIFMAIHYLLDVVRHIDKSIKHQIVFFNGYFIFSSLPLKIAQLFYDYFYLLGDTTSIEVNKVFRDFISITENSKCDPRLQYGCRLHMTSNKGFLTGFMNNIGITNRIVIDPALESQLDSSSEGEFIPTIHLDLFEQASTYKMVTCYEEGFLLLLFYKNRDDISIAKLNEVQVAMNKNIGKLSATLHKQIQKIYTQEDISKLLYENHCNFALRASKMFLKSVESKLFQNIIYMKERFDKDPSCRSIITKCYGYWVYGRVFNQRRVFMLLNGTNNLMKTEEEKEELIKYNFANILY